MSSQEKPVYYFQSIVGLGSTSYQSHTNDPQSLGGACSDAAPFALQVKDDSMQPEFERGCVVVVDPSGVVKDRAYVLVDCNALLETLDQSVSYCVGDERLDSLHSGAKWKESPVDHIVLRQLQHSGETWSIKPLNTAYHELPLGDSLEPVLAAFLGVVVQRAGRRRAFHKRYE